MTLDTKPEPMGWKLFLVDRDLSNDEIVSTFAEIFEIAQDDVKVIEETDEIGNDLSENTRLVCERSPVKGDFQLSLSIYPQDSELEDIAEEIGGELEIIGRFSEISECNCLILDPSKENLEDEDACLLIKAKKEVKEIYIDPDKIDNTEYIVLKMEKSNDKNLLLAIENLNSPLFPLDILVNKSLSEKEICETLAKVFSISPESIMIVKNTDEYIINQSKIQIICQIEPIKGDFKMDLTIEETSSSTNQIKNSFSNEIEVVNKLCDLLDCICLITDPFTEDDDAWLLIEKSGLVQRVYLNSEKLDMEEYILEKHIGDLGEIS
jgi:hypothetical protein